MGQPLIEEIQNDVKEINLTLNENKNLTEDQLYTLLLASLLEEETDG